MTNNLDLHDEVATNLSWQGDTLYLSLKRYDDAAKIYTPYSLVFYKVSGMKIDNNQTDNIMPPSNSGDVLRYTEQDGHASLLIEWHDFKNKTKNTKLYEFKFDHWLIKNST